MFRTTLLSLLFIVTMVPSKSDATNGQLFECKVTQANGVGILGNTNAAGFGNGKLSVGQWENGVVTFTEGGPGFITSDGALGMKFGWRRGVRGQLSISGRRLDAPAPPLRAHISTGNGDFGFQPTYLIFPTPGCWEVTGRVGDASLTFVTNVVKIGDGPRSRLDP